MPDTRSPTSAPPPDERGQADQTTPPAGSQAHGSQPQEQPSTQRQRSFYILLIGSVAAVGGFLFGYDTGVISGAQSFLKQTFHLNATSQELAVASVLVGAIVGAAISGKLADWIGRRWTLIVMGLIFIVGAVLTALATSLGLFMIFRILTGVAIGGASVVAPMYVTELAPPAKRGAMVFLFQFAITVGIVSAYAVDLWFAYWLANWRPMFAVAAIPGAVLAIGIYFLSETPRWLASKGKWDEASAAMERVAGDQTKQEMKRIRQRLEQVSRTSPLELFKNGLRWALLAGVGLAVLQQFIGINTVIYYAPIIAGYSGIGVTRGSPTGADLVGALIVGIVNVAATGVAIFLVDKVGRRTLLFVGTSGLVLTLTAMGAIFLFNAQALGPVLFAVLLLYIVSFAIGLGPVYWLMSAELFPNRLRGTGASISTVGNWSANLLITATYLTMIAVLGKSLTFWVYAACGVVTILFVAFLVPETKDKALEQIEEYWQNGRTWPESAQPR